VFVGGADGVKLWKKGEGLRGAAKSKRGKKRRRAT
jgi:hypothetical protein